MQFSPEGAYSPWGGVKGPATTKDQVQPTRKAPIYSYKSESFQRANLAFILRTVLTFENKCGCPFSKKILNFDKKKTTKVLHPFKWQKKKKIQECQEIIRLLLRLLV